MALLVEAGGVAVVGAEGAGLGLAAGREEEVKEMPDGSVGE
ncbi:hypothetical protein [Propioniciclava flava]|nr:hypothetical protein [Propioniciclava flava]